MLTGVHVNALWKCNVDDLDILQGAAVKIITSYPGGEVKSMNKLNAESQSVVKKHWPEKLEQYVSTMNFLPWS